MAGDLLTKFRETGATSSEPTEYVAFAGKDSPSYLDIRRVAAASHTPFYNYLCNVPYDRQFETSFFIQYPFMVVKVQGRNLREVYFAVQNRKASYIQEYDPGKWPNPPNDKAPFIEVIEIEMRGENKNT